MKEMIGSSDRRRLTLGLCERSQALRSFTPADAQKLASTARVPSTEPQGFHQTVERGGKTYFFFKAYTDRFALTKDVEKLHEMGYSTYVMTQVHVDGLYVYPRYEADKN